MIEWVSWKFVIFQSHEFWEMGKTLLLLHLMSNYNRNATQPILEEWFYFYSQTTSPRQKARGQLCYQLHFPKSLILGNGEKLSSFLEYSPTSTQVEIITTWQSSLYHCNCFPSNDESKVRGQICYFIFFLIFPFYNNYQFRCSKLLLIVIVN